MRLLYLLRTTDCIFKHKMIRFLTLQEGAYGMDIKKGGFLSKNAIFAYFLLELQQFRFYIRNLKVCYRNPFFAISSPQKSMGGIVIDIWEKSNFFGSFGSQKGAKNAIFVQGGL